MRCTSKSNDKANKKHPTHPQTVNATITTLIVAFRPPKRGLYDCQRPLPTKTNDIFADGMQADEIDNDIGNGGSQHKG